MTDERQVNTILNNIVQSRAGGRVERCHGIPHQGSYSNAAHSWGVAMLMFYLWPEDFPRLAIHCLSHDVPEAWAGDIPAPLLRYVPGLRELVGHVEDKLQDYVDLPRESSLSPEDHAKLKACDRLEFYLWTREEYLRGNKFAEESRMEVERYFDEVSLPEPARSLYEAMKERTLLPRQQAVIKEMMS